MPDSRWKLISICTLCGEGDLDTEKTGVVVTIFIYALREEGDVQSRLAGGCTVISIHALREEGDGDRRRGHQKHQDFYPRPPRGGRLHQKGTGAGQRAISIHALREEGDLSSPCPTLPLAISIHALREEGDGAPHPAGARTQHFYPRPPRGGRPACASMSFITVSPFLSTPSARRATQQQQGQRQGLQISIHAIREEGDSSPKPSLWKPSNFYPRPPRGGRHIDEINDHIHKLFLSTPSARRATPLPASGCFLR